MCRPWPGVRTSAGLDALKLSPTPSRTDAPAPCSTLAALSDERVKALFLLDPVDITVYAPLGPDYPSAVAGLEGLGAQGRSLPLAVVGSGLGGDCVPAGKSAAQAPPLLHGCCCRVPCGELCWRAAGMFGAALRSSDARRPHCSLPLPPSPPHTPASRLSAPTCRQQLLGLLCSRLCSRLGGGDPQRRALPGAPLAGPSQRWPSGAPPRGWRA